MLDPSEVWSRTPGLDGKGYEHEPPVETRPRGAYTSHRGQNLHHAPTRPIRRYPTASMPRARTRVGGGLASSIVIHGLIVVIVMWAGTRLTEELMGTGRGPGPAGGGGGGGGPRVTHIELPPLASAAPAARPARPKPKPQPEPKEETLEVPPPEPVVEPELESVEAPEQVLDVQDPVEIAVPEVQQTVTDGAGPGAGGGTGNGPGSGGGTGTGIGTGTGSDVGPGTGGGGRVYAPEPRATPYPVQDPPTSIQGQVFNLHFWVDARGRVTKVEIDPPIRDSRYRKTLLDQVSQWVFYPARTAAGRRVEGELIIQYRP